MTGEGAKPAITVIPADKDPPPWSVPTVFADGITNLAPAHGTVRFYLYRSDPETTGGVIYKNQVFAQIIMPSAGFAVTAAFIERALKHFAAEGSMPLETINAARAVEGLEPWLAPPST